MEIIDAIKEHGISVVLKSVYPKLKGINFNEVDFDIDFTNRGFSSPEGNKDWLFAIGSMPMLYRHTPKLVIDSEIEKILTRNGINLNSGVVDPSGKVTIWKGSGFNIEKLIDDQIALVIVTGISSITKDSIIFNETKRAKQIKSPNWISGIDLIYDAHSSKSNDRDLSSYMLSPLLFNDEDEYILIRIPAEEYAEPLIDKIIDDNGGIESFKKSEHESWSYLHQGHIFTIGYLKEYGCVRINRLPNTAVSVDGTPTESGIHELSSKINEQVKGLNKQVFNPGDGSVADGRLIANSKKANVIVGFDSDSNKLISKFKDIVVQYNEEDPFLKINSDSIKTWLDKNPDPDGDISFSVPDSFELLLSKGNEFYRLNLFPPGGIQGSWPDEPSELNLAEKPKVNFSKDILIKKSPVKKVVNKTIKKDAKKSDLDQTDKIIAEKKEFLESAVVNDQSQSTISSNKSSFFKWIFYIIGIILLIFLLRNCSTGYDAEYYYNKGIKNKDAEKYEKAIKDFDKAIEIDNSYIDPYIARAEMHLNNGDFQSAKFDLDEVITRNPKNWLAFYLRGKANMNMATSKYSRYNKDAIEDFSSSIGLNSTSSNGESYYYRGIVYKKIDDDNDCIDFYQACNFNTLDACDYVDNSCRPKTGYMPYNKTFGEGIYSGNLSFKITNKCEVDLVVTVKSIRTGNIVRSQYVRSGENLTMEQLPNGYFKVESFQGTNWSFTKLLNNGSTKGGFTKDELFKKINDDWNFKLYDKLIFCSTDGNLTHEIITEEEYFN